MWSCKKIVGVCAVAMGLFTMAGEALALGDGEAGLEIASSKSVARPAPCFISLRSKNAQVLINASNLSEIDWGNGVAKFNSGRIYSFEGVIGPVEGYRGRVGAAFEKPSARMVEALENSLNCGSAKYSGLASIPFGYRWFSMDPKMIDYVASAVEGAGERARAAQVIVGPGIFEKAIFDSESMGDESPRAGLVPASEFPEHVRSSAGAQMSKVSAALSRRGLMWSDRESSE